ncbi:hypothetical protein PVAP13_7NG409425 [Panicum virgatum]|uniref:Uncharacterized protein n=1 Tax=Panicum virgatum TaxID=38727 RepID=A0A8T0Q788_PANVG|nr:hypothetical protein PVAP13_7NG409425 [Panicum virgatum]
MESCWVNFAVRYYCFEMEAYMELSCCDELVYMMIMMSTKLTCGFESRMKKQYIYHLILVHRCSHCAFHGKGQREKHYLKYRYSDLLLLWQLLWIDEGILPCLNIYRSSTRIGLCFAKNKSSP